MDARGASLSWEQVEKFSELTDPLADAAVAHLKRFRPAELLARVEAGGREGNPACEAFLDATWTTPRWANPDAIEFGARVARTFGLQQGVALTVGSLAEGYASPSLAAPLVATGRLRLDTLKRVYETGQMFHNIRQPGALAPGAQGHRTILQVRLLHAMVRRHLTRVGYKAPDGGAFVHQLDMAHTASQISYRGIRAMQQLGIDFRPDELEAMHQMWRLAHHHHGVDVRLLPETFEAAAVFHARLAQHRFDPHNPYVRPLVSALLDATSKQPPFYLPRMTLSALCRHVVGDVFCDAWNLERSEWGRRSAEVLMRTNRAASRAYRRFGVVIGAPARLTSDTIHIRTLRGALGAPHERAFGPIADSRWGRRAGV